MPVPRLVSVVVVNFDSGGFLERCLDSLEAVLPAGSWDAVVVDNASSDGSERAAAGRGAAVHLVVNPNNIGFGAAVNEGVRLATARLLLVLNPDCQLRPGTVETLIAELESHPDCAIVAPEVLNSDGSSQGNARGDPSILTGLFGRSSRLARLFPRLPIVRRNVVSPRDLPPEATSIRVDWVSGSCMLVRRVPFERVNGFDGRYFMYWEDADLCRRLRGAGYHIRYVPSAVVEHAQGGSTAGVRALAARAFHRSAYLYYTTWSAPRRWSPVRAAARILLGVRCAWVLSRARTAPGPTAGRAGRAAR